MGMGPGRGMLGAIILINLLATLVTLGIASWAMDELIDRASNQGALTNSGSYQSLAGRLSENFRCRFSVKRIQFPGAVKIELTISFTSA